MEIKEKHGQTFVPAALAIRVDTLQAALALVSLLLNKTQAQAFSHRMHHCRTLFVEFKNLLPLAKHCPLRHIHMHVQTDLAGPLTMSMVQQTYNDTRQVMFQTQANCVQMVHTSRLLAPESFASRNGPRQPFGSF